MGVKVQLYPSSVERGYSRILQGYVEIVTQFDGRFKNVRLDYAEEGEEDLTTLLEELALLAMLAANSVIFRLQSIYGQVASWHDNQWILSVKAGTGLTIPGSSAQLGNLRAGETSSPVDIRSRFGVGVDLFRSEPWLSGLMDNWVDYNTSLIKSIPQQHFAKVEDAIRDGIRRGVSPKDLAGKIKAISGVTEGRAKVIARDQITKANADLTRYRQNDLGIKRYKWLTMNDERVRPTHEANANKTFSWDSPPSATGHPGQDIMCRCAAVAIFDDKPD